MPATTPRLTVGQSDDPDDAFMAWALASGTVTVPGHRVEVVFQDIQTLNEWATARRLDLTALSAGAYPGVADGYRLLASGASFGRDHGPVVVGREPPAAPGPSCLRGLRVGVPGLQTTAFLLLRIQAGSDFEAVPMPFDTILDAVRDGAVDAGLVIHEGQLTFEELGLTAWLEPARAWHRSTGLPVPLGVVAVRRDLDDDTGRPLTAAFEESIAAARRHPEQALAFAARHGRDLDAATLRTFVDQYVDDLTVDMGQEGREALGRLYREAEQAGLLDGVPEIDLLRG